MMGENPNYWWSLNGKLMQPPPPSHHPTNFLSTTPMPVPMPVVPPSSSTILINPHPYLFGSSLLVPSTTNSNNPLSDHHQQENLDFPVSSWSQLLISGLTTNDQVEQENLGGGGHVGEVKHRYLDNIHQQSRQQQQQLYYDHHGTNNKTDNNNDEDIQAAACSSSWSSHHQLNNPVPSVGSSSNTMSLSTTTMFDFSSKINSQQQSHQYSSQYDDTSTSGASKKPRFQSSSSTQQPSPMSCNDTFTSGTSSKRSRAQQSATQTPLKVRKEKLGDRISALHQLVSPFGKTDTASVLLEATAQIRFLESQIEALTSPYMNLANNNNVSGGTRHQHSADEKRDLASRGLCLVPVTCMDHIDTTNMTTNGAEFWTPALGGGL